MRKRSDSNFVKPTTASKLEEENSVFKTFSKLNFQLKLPNISNCISLCKYVFKRTENDLGTQETLKYFVEMLSLGDT